MENLLRRSHELVLKFKDNETISFRYSEATVLETLQHAEEASRPGFMPVRWLFDFLASRTAISEEEFGRLADDLRAVYDAVMRTRFPGAFAQPEEDGRARESRYSPLSAYLVDSAARLNTDPLSLIERYTFTQLSVFMGGVVWNLNEQTPQ